MIKSIIKRWHWLTKVHFDKLTGFYYYHRYGHRIYIRRPRHFLTEKKIRWLCENILFHYYTPSNGEQIVDLGIGYGEEAIFLKSISPGTKYIGVEPQPVIYECVSNTFRELNPNYIVSPFLVTTDFEVKFASRYSYASVGMLDRGYIEIPTLSWPEFIKRYNINTIDLLTMNIEGSEKQLIESIDDFSMIKRLLVSCHDHRAENGDGEFYRTKKYVTTKLKREGYKLSTFNYGIDWSDDYIFAVKTTSHD
mgnify:CR=1 FL=1